MTINSVQNYMKNVCDISCWHDHTCKSCSVIDVISFLILVYDNNGNIVKTIELEPGFNGVDYDTCDNSDCSSIVIGRDNNFNDINVIKAGCENGIKCKSCEAISSGVCEKNSKGYYDSEDTVYDN